MGYQCLNLIFWQAFKVYSEELCRCKAVTLLNKNNKCPLSAFMKKQPSFWGDVSTSILAYSDVKGHRSLHIVYQTTDALSQAPVAREQLLNICTDCIWKSKLCFPNYFRSVLSFWVRPILQPATGGNCDVLSSLSGFAYVTLLSLRSTGKGDNLLLHIHVMDFAVFIFLQSTVLIAFSAHRNPTLIPWHQQFVLSSPAKSWGLYNEAGLGVSEVTLG